MENFSLSQAEFLKYISKKDRVSKDELSSHFGNEICELQLSALKEYINYDGELVQNENGSFREERNGYISLSALGKTTVKDYFEIKAERRKQSRNQYLIPSITTIFCLIISLIASGIVSIDAVSEIAASIVKKFSIFINSLLNKCR